jgi:hypothetical protein
VKVQVVLTESVVTAERCFQAGELWECANQAEASSLVASGFAVPLSGDKLAAEDTEPKKANTPKAAKPKGA